MGIAPTNPLPGYPSPVPGLAALPDEALIEGHAFGNDGYFLELVNRYQGGLYRLILRMVGNVADAQDVLQEVLVQAHVSAKTFDATRRAKPWLFTIAANRCRDLLRKRRRTSTDSLDHPTRDGTSAMIDLLQSRIPDPSSEAERADVIVSLRHALAKLSPAQGVVIELAFIQQLPYQEISKVLDIPIGTVKSRVHSAVAFLAKEMKASNLGKSRS